MKNFEHINATSFEEASSALMSNRKSQPVAGGTDLIGTLKIDILPENPELLVNLKNIEGAEYIKDNGDSISIGALTKLCDVESSDLMKKDSKAVARRQVVYGPGSTA